MISEANPMRDDALNAEMQFPACSKQQVVRSRCEVPKYMETMCFEERPPDALKLPVEVVVRGSTSINRFRIDWEDLLWSTLQNLGIPIPSPGPDEVILAVLREYLNYQKSLATTFYANPAFVVKGLSNESPKNFIREARKAQQAFWRLAKQSLGSHWRETPPHLIGHSRRDADQAALYRMGAVNGFLIVNGRQIHPKLWPDQRRQTDKTAK